MFMSFFSSSNINKTSYIAHPVCIAENSYSHITDAEEAVAKLIKKTLFLVAFFVSRTVTYPLLVSLCILLRSSAFLRVKMRRKETKVQARLYAVLLVYVDACTQWQGFSSNDRYIFRSPLISREGALYFTRWLVHLIGSAYYWSERSR